MIGQGKYEIMKLRNSKNIIKNSSWKFGQFPSFFISQFLLMFLVGLFWSNPAHGATLYSGAANQVVYQGQSFVVDWYLDSQDSAINTINLKLKYPSTLLDVVDVSAGNSALDLWVKSPTFSAQDGTIELTGGISGGLQSNRIPVFSVTFMPKATGEARINLDGQSQVLIADGQGTQAPLLFDPLVFTINPAEAALNAIHSDTHPDQTKWYKDNRVVLKFQPQDGEQYSYSFSSNAELFPDNTADPLKDEYVYDNLPDGVYYFKLNSRQGTGAWTEAGVYRVQIDATPPEQFEPAVASDSSIFDGSPFLSFAAKDKASGVAHYEIRYGHGNWQPVDQTVVRIPGLVLGSSIEIKAVDEAGNEQVSRVDLKNLPQSAAYKQWFFWGIMILAGLAAVFAAYLVYKRLNRKYQI
jgi:hypothetical protein